MRLSSPASELSSFQSLLRSDASAAATFEQQRRAELKAKSTARSAQWPNTLQAQRSAKRAQRELHRQQEEAQNAIIDAAEAKFRESERQRIVDRAERMLYKERDSVKNMQTGINLAVINRDRSAQVDERSRQRRAEAEEDAAFHATAEAIRTAGLAVEEAKTTKQRPAAPAARTHADGSARRLSCQAGRRAV